MAQERTRRDVIVIGSLSVVHALADADLVDEYRLITFPTVAGEGDHLFARGKPADFRFTFAEASDAEALTVLTTLRWSAKERTFAPQWPQRPTDELSRRRQLTCAVR